MSDTLLDFCQVQDQRTIELMRPLGKWDFDHQHGNCNHQKNHIQVKGCQLQLEQPQKKRTKKDGHKKMQIAPIAPKKCIKSSPSPSLLSSLSSQPLDHPLLLNPFPSFLSLEAVTLNWHLNLLD
jgi:hypothetical protein